jgi:DNA repair exonuclease SbcCD ATPase subunit
MDVSTVSMSSGISAGIALVLWLVVKRPLYRVDRLESEVADLRDDKIQTLDSQAAKAAESRKNIHEHITDIRTHFVHVDQCRRQHEKMESQNLEFRATVLKLERVSERTDAALERGGEMLNQIINMKADMAGLCAKVEGLKRG